VSFGCSTLLLCNSTPTHRPHSKPFGSCVTCFVFFLLLPPSCTTTHCTRPTRLAGYPLSANRVIFSLPPSHPLTRISREIFLRFLSSPRVGGSFLTSSGGPNFLYIGPRPLPVSSNGLVRSLVSRSGRYGTCLVASRGDFLPTRFYRYISRLRGGLIFKVCLYSLLL